MASTTATSADTAGNPPQALRMAVIAFLMFNILIGTMWGSFSVLLAAAQERLGVGPEQAALGVPVANIATAAGAALLAVLAARYSLRLLMILGSLLGTAGFVLLALANSLAPYLLAYGLLGLGGAAAVVLSATLVTRWYKVNRGRTLGLIVMPVVVTVIPPLSNWSLKANGLINTYWMLAAICAVAVVVTLFVIDRPATEAADADTAQAAKGSEPASSVNFRASGRFWALAIGSVAAATGSIILTTFMVPIATTSWGYSSDNAALLLSIQSLVGIGGTVLFGWLGDRLGGALAMALLLINSVVLWLLLLIPLPFPAMALVIGLIGLNAAGALPMLGLALSHIFGAERFSGAFGLANMLNAPFSLAAVPAAAWIYGETGSYSGAITAMVIFMGIAAVLVFFARSRRTQAA